MLNKKQLSVLALIILPCTQYAQTHGKFLTPHQTNASHTQEVKTTNASLIEEETTKAINKAIDNYLATQQKATVLRTTNALESNNLFDSSAINDLQAACTNIRTKAQQQFETHLSTRKAKSQKEFAEKKERIKKYSLRTVDTIKMVLESHSKSLMELKEIYGSVETPEAQEATQAASNILTSAIQDIYNNALQDLANMITHVPEKTIDTFLKTVIPATITLILQSERINNSASKHE
ncbi:MAG TPA: hypothetical protein VGT41_06335 [Candidatus Babeliales bacterium]|nr:hypothetical protein [Candidatus Babeliales bacterium]